MAFEIFGTQDTINVFGTQLSTWSLIVAAIIMTVGVIIAKVASVFFKRYFAANLEVNTAKKISILFIPGVGGRSYYF